jgi:hypothetical protein
MSAPFSIYERKFHYFSNAWLTLKASALHIFSNKKQKLLNVPFSLVYSLLTIGVNVRFSLKIYQLI